MRHVKLLGIAVVVGCGGAMAACSDLTDIKNTGIVQPESENNAVGAAAFYAGATQKFVAATQNSIMFTGLFTDEWIDGTNGGVFGYLDARRAQTSVVQTGQELTDYSNALIAVRFATEALLKYAPKPGSRVAQMYSYSGYLELFLAEQFCNGIPFGNIDFNGTVTHGAGITTAETYARAIAHFDSAIAVSDSARVTNLALLGKGRALVGLGKFAEAAAAVAAVPTNFVYNLDINAAVAGNQNTLYTFGTLNKRTGVSPGANGINGINWVGAADPRVRVQANGKALDGIQDVFTYLPFNGLGAPVPIATGIAARLIQAEAALQANNNDAATTGTGWLGILNTLRTSGITPAMTPLADPGSFAARVDLLFRERAFWLYLTANRMPDMRRLVRQYGRAENTVFPTGTYKDNLPYGTEVNFVAPTLEGPNPAYTGCIDRKA